MSPRVSSGRDNLCLPFLVMDASTSAGLPERQIGSRPLATCPYRPDKEHCLKTTARLHHWYLMLSPGFSRPLLVGIQQDVDPLQVANTCSHIRVPEGSALGHISFSIILGRQKFCSKTHVDYL